MKTGKVEDVVNITKQTAADNKLAHWPCGHTRAHKQQIVITRKCKKRQLYLLLS
jgi:hypothetical protein